MSTTNEINRTEASVKFLRREFEKYFSGANDRPPFELEARIQSEIRRLKSATASVENQFRLSALESSFSTYREMYRRRVREQEVGPSRRPIATTAAPSLPDPTAGVRVDREVSDEAALSLYRGLYGNARAPAVGFDQFKGYLAKQSEAIRERTGCKSIVFRLAGDDGKQRLKAKPLH